MRTFQSLSGISGRWNVDFPSTHQDTGKFQSLSGISGRWNPDGYSLWFLNGVFQSLSGISGRWNASSGGSEVPETVSIPFRDQRSVECYEPELDPE